MPLHPGATFGAYEVLSPLGAGGMGEVYRARDLKLQREVALKVLRDALARDGDRRARFERESHVLAALNHPHIAGIYGVAEAQGVTALVLELVEGPTLEQRLADGPLPLEESTAIARQVAEALDAAHQAGIVHRDLKPANIKLRPDGSVKVLDFGLAKASGGLSAIADSDSPTVLGDATAAGLILGTAAYMSPEQARGRAVDKRTDIWAFGAVVWEMVTGQRLFAGETLTDTLAAVLTREIDWSQLPPSTPPALVALLRRCLERDPSKRLRDIGDARLDDGALSTMAAVGPVPSSARRWWMLGLATVAAFVLGVAIGRNVRGAAVATPPAAEVRFTFPADDPNFAAISPDGSMAVVASGGPLRVRDLVGVSLRELSGTDGAVKPFWSPDSRTIGFGRAGRLWRVGATGGAPVVICDLPAGTWDQDAGGAWLPDDTIVFTTGGSPLMRVPAAGGDPSEYLTTTTTAGEQHFHSVRALPGAIGLIYVVHRESGPDTLEVFAGGNRRVLLRAAGQTIRDPVYSPTGHILFGRTPVNEGVWALPFSLERLDATGTAYLVEAGLGTPSISTTGTFLSLPVPTTVPTRLQWFTADGTPRDAIGEAAQFDVFPELSPDGTKIAIGERLSGAWGLSVIDLARNTRVRLAVGERISTPAWAPDGRSILYSATPDGASEPVIRRVWLDGSPSQSLEPGFRPFSRDGVRYFFDRLRNSDFDVLVGTLDQTAPIETFVGGALVDVAPRPSPNGRLVAHMSMQSLITGNPEVVLRRSSAAGERWQVSSGGGAWPRWSHQSDRLYYNTADGIYEVGVTATGETVTLSRPRRLFARRAPMSDIGPDGFDVAKDGRFLLLERVASSTERFVQVVLNWTPRRAPGS